MIIVFAVLFSGIWVSNAYGSIYLDKATYTWTDKINIRITEHGLDSDKSSVNIFTDYHELSNYKLSKAGNGLYTGEIILTGFLHDVTGDGKPDTNPRTKGSGSNNGFLEASRDDSVTIRVEFGDGGIISKSFKIFWNEGGIVLDKSKYLPGESAKIQVIDADMNLNPESLDKTTIHVFSDSDSAGIMVDAIESDEKSGVFETAVSFTQKQASSGNRLFAVSGDSIYAKYDDYTLPKPFRITDNLEIVAESVLVAESLVPEPEQDNLPYQNCHKGAMLQDGLCVGHENNAEENSTGIGGPVIEMPWMSPIKQWKNGLEPIKIDCRDGRFLMINPENNKPACLFNSKSMVIFAQKGWMPVRNLVLENPADAFTSGHGGDFSTQYFSFFEINNKNSILLHSKQDKKLVSHMEIGEKLISNCLNFDGSSEITLITLKNIDISNNTSTFTSEKQTWPGGFCDNDEAILEKYYSEFFFFPDVN